MSDPPAFAQSVFNQGNSSAVCISCAPTIQPGPAAGADEPHYNAAVNEVMSLARSAARPAPPTRPRSKSGAPDPDYWKRDRPNGRAAARHHPAAERPLFALLDSPSPTRVIGLPYAKVHVPQPGGRSPTSPLRWAAGLNWTPLPQTARYPSSRSTRVVSLAGADGPRPALAPRRARSFSPPRRCCRESSARSQSFLGGRRRGPATHLRPAALPLRTVAAGRLGRRVADSFLITSDLPRARYR